MPDVKSLILSSPLLTVEITLNAVNAAVIPAKTGINISELSIMKAITLPATSNVSNITSPNLTIPSITTGMYLSITGLNSSNFLIKRSRTFIALFSMTGVNPPITDQNLPFNGINFMPKFSSISP